MAHTHYCYRCLKDAKCREEAKPIEGAHTSATAHFCPTCGNRLATVYG